MAKRRIKKRTHPPPPSATSNGATKPGSRTPKSMVLRIGASELGPSVSQLVLDTRSLLEPLTASRLKERRGNKLRDYTTMAGPLGVTHLLLFSKSEKGNVNLRIALTPRGPTLWFRVEEYSLCKDIQKSLRRPKGGEFTASPLLVMNNFTTPAPKDGETAEQDGKKVPKHLESLTTSVFQSLFPPINPVATPLKNIKRVLLLDRLPTVPSSDSDAANYTLNLRHYAIETRTARSVPKALRRLDAAEKLASQKRKRSGLPNLGKLGDVADYLLDPHAADGFTSGSDSEADTDAEVEVLAPTAQRVQRREAKSSGRDRRDTRPSVERKGIKLHELGPRLKLRMTKVEEGVCGGKVMWHEYLNKTPEEIKAMEKVHEQRRQAKELRKKEQKINVERKKAERRAARLASGAKVADLDAEEDEAMDEEDAALYSGGDEDDEWDDDDDEDMVDAGAEEEEEEE